MTEAEWLACEDPTAMLLSSRSKGSERKVRLVATGCCRLAWHRLSDWRCRRAVEIAEKYADGEAATNELVEASSDIHSGRKFSSARLVKTATQQTAFAAGINTLHILKCLIAEDASTRASVVRVSDVRLVKEAKMMRCIFGNPFCPVEFSPEWRTDTALALARQMYESRDFGAMPILADALQDAGCDNEDILNHCRDTSHPHVRGCWVVDLVLAKEQQT